MRPHFCSNVDDAAFIQISQSLFTNIRYIARDLLRPKLGIASIDLVLFNMYRGKVVFTDDTFANKNSIFVVATLPAHKSDEDVLSEGKLTVLSR